MRRFITMLFILSILLVSFAGSALAQDTPGDAHNCAGDLTSSFAGPGFGQFVSSIAHSQGVDNLGFANCGDTSRNNP